MELVKGVFGGGLIALLFFLAFEIAEHKELKRIDLQKQSWVEQGFPIDE